MDSYNSTNPASYYTIGTPYMFYTTIASAQEALESDVKKYKKSLDAVKSVPAIGSSALKATRYIGVVVDIDEEAKQIFVLFKNEFGGNEEYLMKKYVVASSSGCMTDNMETMEAVSATAFQTSSAMAAKKAKVGGITIATASDEYAVAKAPKKVGGITVADNKGKVGGITVVDKPKIGGITLA